MLLFCSYFTQVCDTFCIALAVLQNPAKSTKMPLEREEQQKPIHRKGGQNSVLGRVKVDEDIFRHRIESLPGNRPNSTNAH